jgi:hypothetical protein
MVVVLVYKQVKFEAIEPIRKKFMWDIICCCPNSPSLLPIRILGQHGCPFPCVVACKAIGHLSTIVGRCTSAMTLVVGWSKPCTSSTRSRWGCTQPYSFVLYSWYKSCIYTTRYAMENAVQLPQNWAVLWPGLVRVQSECVLSSGSSSTSSWVSEWR